MQNTGWYSFTFGIFEGYPIFFEIRNSIEESFNGKI